VKEEASLVELLERIESRLGQLVALTAAPQISGLKQKDAVERLGAIGLSAKEIAELTGYAVTSVAPVLSRLRPGSGKKS
jgi:DNA-directed RNA polymerase specialized sigma24 family protein